MSPPRPKALDGLLAGAADRFGTQSPQPAIAENRRIIRSVFRDACAGLDLAPRRLVFGSGPGIPCHEGDAPLDLAGTAAEIGPDLDASCAEPRLHARR